jgi:hypothetical protein
LYEGLQKDGVCTVGTVGCWVCIFMQAALESGWQVEMLDGFSQGRCSLGLCSAQWGVGTLSMG